MNTIEKIGTCGIDQEYEVIYAHGVVWVIGTNITYGPFMNKQDALERCQQQLACFQPSVNN